MLMGGKRHKKAKKAKPPKPRRQIICGRLVREQDGNAADIFTLHAALSLPDGQPFDASSEPGRLRLKYDRCYLESVLRALLEKPKGTAFVNGNGDPCPRCARLTDTREHVAITDKLLAQKTYFTRWFNCPDRECGGMIFPEQFKVVNDLGVRRKAEARLACKLAGYPIPGR